MLYAGGGERYLSINWDIAGSYTGIVVCGPILIPRNCLTCLYACIYIIHMTINALKLRQSLGKILDKVKKSDEPLIIEKGREPVAVLISFKAFQERFVDYREEQKRRDLLISFRDNAAKPAVNTLKAVRELRYGPGH